MLYAERCPQKQAQFQEELAQLNPDTVAFLDEAGVDNRLFRVHARAPRGQKITVDIPGKKTRTSQYDWRLYAIEVIAPFTLRGCNADVSNAWLDFPRFP